jgi:hypothetical protein
VFAVGSFLFHALFDVFPEGLLGGVKGFLKGSCGFFTESLEGGVVGVVATLARGFDHVFVELPDLRCPSGAFPFVSGTFADVSGGGVEDGVKESLPGSCGKVLGDGAVVEFGDKGLVVVCSDRVAHELEGVEGS